MELSTAQRSAAEYLNAPTIISAGAGSGKTYTLTNKFAHLLKLGYDPDRILCITFTNKAANELKDRLVMLTGLPHHSFIWTRTIHSACLQMLKPYFGRIDYRDPVTIYGTSDQRRLVRNSLRGRKVDAKEYLLPILKIISDAKDHSDPKKYIDQYLTDKRDPRLNLISHKLLEVFDEYMANLRNNNAIDFDDILWYTYYLLSNDPDFKNTYRNHFQYILVDEFQDVNHIQNEIIKMLVQETNLTVVGDDFQAIYRWRGSNPEFFIEFEKHFPNAQLFKLEQNFRSSKGIVEISNHLIKNNKRQIKKVCFSTIEPSIKPSIVKFPDDEDESDTIARACLKYQKEGMSLNDIAILYRAKFISRSIEQALVSYSLPYTVVGAVAFFERREIKDIMSYLLLSLNPNDEMAFERCLSTPKRGIGKKTIEKIKNSQGQDLIYKSAYCLKNGSIGGRAQLTLDMLISFVYKLKDKKPSDAINDIIEFTDYYTYMKGFSIDEDDVDDRMANIQELIGLSTKCNTLEDFIEECSLLNADSNEDSEESVKLMTVHAAKGLEFKVVFVIGMEDGLFPHHRALKEDRDMKSNINLEEERRLFYVAITRPEQMLNITYCRKRTCSFASAPSRFLKEISKFCKIVDLTK